MGLLSKTTTPTGHLQEPQQLAIVAAQQPAVALGLGHDDLAIDDRLDERRRDAEGLEEVPELLLVGRRHAHDEVGRVDGAVAELVGLRLQRMGHAVSSCDGLDRLVERGRALVERDGAQVDAIHQREVDEA